MDIQEALAYIDGTQWFGSKPGLSRTEALLDKLGRPQDGLKFVHIAGTNGKGSCAAMLASILKTAGYRTGLYTSPYLFRFHERMQVNGRPVGDEALAELVTRIRPLAEAMEDHPTEFEIITAAALRWFADEGCDIVVLEVGLGGRLDATNVIAAPEAAVLMNIGLDHTAVLGGTLEQIAAEKAGILKPGCEAAVYQQRESVLEVFRQRAALVGAGVRVADFSQLVPEFDSLEGQTFTYRGQPYALSLLGGHQLRNAAVVLETVEILRRRGWRLSPEDVEHGLYAAVWPARFELVSQEPPFIVDGGHNPQCAESVRDNLLHYFPDKRRVLLVGVLADKDYPALFEILNGVADEWVCVTPDSDRALPAAELGAFLERFGKPVTVCGSIPEGVETAREKAGEDGMACAVGSLYMAGAVRACFGLT
jgi:dihydrofolate synthase/folylpolyglutamate synthase